MPKFIAAVEVNRFTECREAQVDRLTRQLRDALAKNAKAFEQGAAMVINAMRQGASLEEVATKVRWELLMDAVPPRTVTKEEDDTARVAIPLEMDDSDEYTDPGVDLASLTQYAYHRDRVPKARR